MLFLAFLIIPARASAGLIYPPPVDIFQSSTTKTGNAPLIWVYNSTTTTGVAFFYLTDTNTPTGNALYSSIYGVQPSASVNTATAIAVPSCAVKLISADLKTISVNCVTGQNIGILGAASAVFATNGTVVYLQVVGNR